MNRISTLTEKASELGNEASASMEELSRSAGRKLDDTGEALHAAAASVRATGRKGSEAIGNLANGTADRLDATATYVEDHDLNDAVTGLRRFARRHLTGSMIAAGAIGFLFGSALLRATHSCAKVPAATRT